MAPAQVSAAPGRLSQGEVGRREVKALCGSGSPGGAPEVTVRGDSVSVPGEARKAFAAEIPCLSSLPQGCIARPRLAAHSSLPRDCQDPRAQRTASLQRDARQTFLSATWLLVPSHGLSHPSTWLAGT